MKSFICPFNCMTMKPLPTPQVPGGAMRNADDGTQTPRGPRGDKNLRAGISNHQTTNAKNRTLKTLLERIMIGT